VLPLNGLIKQTQSSFCKVFNCSQKAAHTEGGTDSSFLPVLQQSSVPVVFEEYIKVRNNGRSTYNVSQKPLHTGHFSPPLFKVHKYI
jgi:hypothetical protein